MALSELAQIRAIINSNLDKIEIAYAKGNLDVSQCTYKNTNINTIIDPPTATPEIMYAASTLVGAGLWLKDTFKNTGQALISRAAGGHIALAMAVVAEADTPQIILDLEVESGREGQGVTAAEIKKRTDETQDTSIDCALFERILRYLCSDNFFVEITPGVFSNTRNSIVLCKVGAAGGLELSNRAIVQHTQDEVGFSMYNSSQVVLGRPNRVETLFDARMKGRFTKDIEEARAAGKNDPPSPFQVAVGGPIELWQFGSARLDRFHTAMAFSGKIFTPIQSKTIPWSQYGPNLVDLGGGKGELGVAILEAHKDVSVIVQDLAPAVNAGKALYEESHRDLLDSGRLAWQIQDFFTTNQMKKGEVDTYIMRHIMHDWKDDKNLIILKHLKDVMTDKSRIMILDHVIETAEPLSDSASAPEGSLQFSPSPLSKTAGNTLQYGFDMQMLAVGSLERTLDQWQSLFDKAGLKLVTVHRLPANLACIELSL